MYALVYDFGTTAVKACLFSVGENIRMLAHANAGYALYILDNGGAEQDTEEWWRAIITATRELFQKTDVRPSEISAMSFSAQMQGVVLVDKDGNALRRPMSYMDQRASKEFENCLGKGFFKISNCNAFKLFKNLWINRTASMSVKDPVWKYNWVRNHEPEIFQKVYKWLDVKDYLVARCTGNITRTVDSAFSTFLYDTRKGKERWNLDLARMYDVKPEHLPILIQCSDEAGKLTSKAAKELGLPEGLPVFGGGGDATLTGLGAGCSEVGQTHIYIGTSGWVSTLMDHQAVDFISMITGVMAGTRGYYNYFAEMETAGKCLEWAKDHLALDEIGVYAREARMADDLESGYISLYDYLTKEAGQVPAGSNGVIFAPWLHGNRCPFEDSSAAGIFFNLKLDNGKRDMIRATLEGICFHLRWMLECETAKVKTSDRIRFVGGGALSPVTCQMLADITGRVIETVESPQDAGAVGAAALIALGMGVINSPEAAGKMITVNAVYYPNSANKAVYDRNYRVFRKLYKNNAAAFQALNGALEEK